MSWARVDDDAVVPTAPAQLLPAPPAPGSEVDRREHQVLVAFDVTADSPWHAAWVVADALGQHGAGPHLADVMRLRRGRLESWWLPEARFKHIDGNDNGTFRLVPDLASDELYVEDDAEDEPTVWKATGDPERPLPVLTRTDLRAAVWVDDAATSSDRLADLLWTLLAAALPTSPPAATP